MVWHEVDGIACFSGRLSQFATVIHGLSSYETPSVSGMQVLAKKPVWCDAGQMILISPFGVNACRAALQ
jgi:hypothetical protein